MKRISRTLVWQLIEVNLEQTILDSQLMSLMQMKVNTSSCYNYMYVYFILGGLTAHNSIYGEITICNCP